MDIPDILIKNLGLPSEGKRIDITILSDGSVIEHFPDGGGKWSSYRSGGVTAIELQPHGRCIDADQLQDVLRLVLSLVVSNELTEKEISLVHRTIGAISEAINDLDTVLEAST